MLSQDSGAAAIRVKDDERVHSASEESGARAKRNTVEVRTARHENRQIEERAKHSEESSRCEATRGESARGKPRRARAEGKLMGLHAERAPRMRHDYERALHCVRRAGHSAGHSSNRVRERGIVKTRCASK